MSCSACEAIVERSDVPHVIRTGTCGRQLRVAEPGEKGKGIRITWKRAYGTIGGCFLGTGSVR